jgi:hypothetical protein
MPTSFYFGGKKIIRPGVYSRILSGRNNPPLDLDYGTVLIIDSLTNDGLTNNGIRGGAGVAGEHSTGKDSIYEFTNIQDFREFVGYGWWYKAADLLFNPNGANPGVSKLIVIKPATTTSSVLTFTATGGGAAGGTFKFDTLDEGLAANGALTSTKLTSGYAYTIETGVLDAAKWILKVWRGEYKGAYSDGIAYDEVASSITDEYPTLLVQSPEFNNIQTLIDWAGTDSIFGSYFILDPTSAKVGTGAVIQADVTAVAGFNVSTGGTQTYNKMDEALEAVRELPYNWVMYTVADPTAVHSDANILKIRTHILSVAKYDKFLLVGGGDAALSTSITSAASLNSDRVHIVPGGIYKVSQVTASGYRLWNSFFHACLYVGRLCGLPPQVPVTAKALDIDKLQLNLTIADQEKALVGGVLATIYDPTRKEFVCLQGINTLQNNTYQLNPDGTSFSIQLRRIAAQINYELIVNASTQLLNNPVGTNRHTLSEKDLVEWVKGYLGRKLATDTQDNLLISYRNVTCVRDQDSYFVTYEFEANTEINKIFLTGFML